MSAGMATLQCARKVSGKKSRAHASLLCFYINFSVPKVTCEDLDDPDYGKVWQSGTKVGSIAKYFCNKGFKLVGNLKRQCQYDGEWSGDEPVCKKSESGEPFNIR